MMWRHAGVQGASPGKIARDDINPVAGIWWGQQLAREPSAGLDGARPESGLHGGSPAGHRSTLYDAVDDDGRRRSGDASGIVPAGAFMTSLWERWGADLDGAGSD